MHGQAVYLQLSDFRRGSDVRGADEIVSCPSIRPLLLLRFFERSPLRPHSARPCPCRAQAAVSANFGGDLANLLLVDPLDHDFGLRRAFRLDAFRHLVHHRVRETQRQVQLVALRLGTDNPRQPGSASSRNPCVTPLTMLLTSARSVPDIALASRLSLAGSNVSVPLSFSTFTRPLRAWDSVPSGPFTVI